MRATAFIVDWEHAQRSGPYEYFSLPEQADSPNDRAALDILRACLPGSVSEQRVRQLLNAPSEIQRAIVQSMRTIVAKARADAAQSAFPGCGPDSEAVSANSDQASSDEPPTPDATPLTPHDHRSCQPSPDLAAARVSAAESQKNGPELTPDEQKQTTVKWNLWALGFDNEKKQWVLFRRDGVKWERNNRTIKVSAGQPHDLLMAFAEGGGFLSAQNAVKRCCRGDVRPDNEFRKRVVVPAVARVRGFIRKLLGVADKFQDPLPNLEQERGWQATIEIGYAVQEESSYAGGGTFLCFKTSEQLAGIDRAGS
jgi:hypothetical protein